MLIVNEIITLIDLEGIRLEAASPIAIGLAVASVVGSVFGSISANGRAKRAAAEKLRLTGELDALESARQPVINPYAGVTDLSSMVNDLSGLTSATSMNLSVATGAAEMQAEQTDIALANTLDTLRATGASAGGATALARMALESKKGVSAGIQQQEANNNQMMEQSRVQGEVRLQNIKLAEAQRVQGGLMAEAGRMQEVDVSGKKYEYEETERRQTEQMNRKQAQITGQAQAEAQARADTSASISAGVNALGNVAAAFAGAPGKPKDT
jgi:hypothetical protein